MESLPNWPIILFTTMIVVGSVGFGVWLRTLWSSRSGRKISLRVNVLYLVGFGYGTVLIFFIFMCWKGGVSPDTAYDAIQGPLMTLIGGSLAIAKDLINVDDPNYDEIRQKSIKTLNHHADEGNNDGRDKD